MIKFFRKIRQQLITEGKFSKYLLYGIGEILLVVIGILIALQINNWNQARAKDQMEIEILKLLREDLIEANHEFDRSLTLYSTAKKSIDLIVKHMESDRAYHDSLKPHFFNTTLYWGTSSLTNSTFETLKSHGIELISKKELRDKINLVFDEHDTWIENDENKYIDIIIDAGKNIFSTRFYDYWNGEEIDDKYVGEMIPLDFESLREDQEYLFFLKSLKYEMKWLVEVPIQKTKIEVDQLIEQIDLELKERE